MEEWFFTFGVGHVLHDRFIRLRGTYIDARCKMIDSFGTKWAFQYSAEEFKDQPEKWGYTELEIK